MKFKIKNSKLRILLRGPPDLEHSRRTDFIDSGDRGVVRGRADQIGVPLGFPCDGEHGVAELFDLFRTDTLGGLDHQRAVDDEREAHGRWVEAVVEEPFGDVGVVDIVLGLFGVVKDHFVQGR